MTPSDRTALCGSTDTVSGDPCHRSVPVGEACFMHSEDGPPSDHGAPSESMRGNRRAVGNAGGSPADGNTNARIHGRTMDPEDLRETFTEEESDLYATLKRNHREEFPEGSEERATEAATAVVMFDRLTVELLDAGFNRTPSGPDGEEYEALDTAKLDGLMEYHRDLRAIEEAAREARHERREREEKEMLAVLVGGMENLDVDRETPEWASEDETEPEGPEGPATPTEPPSPPAAGGILTRTALADGSGEPTDSETSDADGDEEDTDGEDEEDESPFRVPRYVKIAYQNRRKR